MFTLLQSCNRIKENRILKKQQCFAYKNVLKSTKKVILYSHPFPQSQFVFVIVGAFSFSDHVARVRLSSATRLQK